MLRLGAIFRTLTLAMCLVPFTSAQQATGALAPFLPATPPAGSETPGAPVNEEDDERETEDGKERHASPTRYRPPTGELIGWLPPAHASRPPSLARSRATPPAAADPFRNGLGTPYRC